VFVNDLPRSVWFGVIQSPFAEEGGRPCSERSIEAITVANDPAQIFRTPKDLLVMVVKNPLKALLAVEEIARRGVKNPFGFPRASTGVKDEKGILCIHDFRSHLFSTAFLGHEFIPGEVSSLHHFRRFFQALHHDDAFDARTFSESKISLLLERKDFSPGE